MIWCAIFQLFSLLSYVQCEPSVFAKDVGDIFRFAALHSSSIQPYFAANRSISTAEVKSVEKIWMFVRHGSRTAKSKEKKVFEAMENGLRTEIVENLMVLKKCPLSQKNWKNLKNWRWDSAFNDDRKLTPTGKHELVKIAETYKKRFSHLFKPNDMKNINALCTNTSRTIESAQTFLDTIFGKSGDSENCLQVATKAQEDIIKAYKLKEFNDKNHRIDASEQNLVKIFSGTEKFKKVIKDVNERLHFTDVVSDSARKRVMNMYDLCRYEGIWHSNSQSPWCSVFTKEEFLVLEYAKDLHSFSENGPSLNPLNKLNFLVHCPSVQNMVEHLSSSNKPKVTAYFTHSPAILLHLTAMGAFAGGPQLTPYQIPEKFEWKTSKLSPMGAHFAAVRYKNDKVKFFLNDEVVHLPGCNGGECAVQSLRNIFGRCFK